MPLKTVYVLGQTRKSLPGNRLEGQSPDVEVQKITLTHWRIFFFVFVFPAVAQIMLCLRKRERFDSQAKNCRQNGSKCCLLCNMLQCAVKIFLTTNAIINVHFTPNLICFPFFLVWRSQKWLVFVLQLGVSIWAPILSSFHSLWILDALPPF